MDRTRAGGNQPSNTGGAVLYSMSMSSKDFFHFVTLSPFDFHHSKPVGALYVSIPSLVRDRLNYVASHLTSKGWHPIGTLCHHYASGLLYHR